MSTRFTLAVGVCLALMTVMLGADARAQVIYFGAEGGWSGIPPVGGGVGDVNVQDQVSVPGLGRVLRDDDWRFGYRAIGGVRYNVTPDVAVDLDYRYLATTEATFRVPANPGIKYKSG